jgi:putative hydrolase of the HAD superfamily
MTIEAILFDADGVVQRQAVEWRDALGKVLGSTDSQLDGFLSDVFAAERPALTGKCEFKEALSEVFARWRCHGSLEDALGVWTMIDVQLEVVEAIRWLRQTGVSCYLATNQQSYRARHMSEALGYCSLFDREFYSCAMGLAKPDPDFFRAILKEIQLPPGGVLFLDDHEINVYSARQVGLHASLYSSQSGSDSLHDTLREFGIKVTRSAAAADAASQRS